MATGPVESKPYARGAVRLIGLIIYPSSVLMRRGKNRSRKLSSHITADELSARRTPHSRRGIRRAVWLNEYNYFRFSITRIISSRSVDVVRRGPPRTYDLLRRISPYIWFSRRYISPTINFRYYQYYRWSVFITFSSYGNYRIVECC